MFIHGSFLDVKGREVEVRILTHRDASEELEIGSDRLSFCGEEAVEISGQVNDTFDVLLRSHATIRLLTDRFMPDLFVGNARDGVVNVRRGGELLFAGYLEPHTYSQPFVERLDELELNCIDALSALQYSRYGDVANDGDFVRAVQGAVNRSLKDIVADALTDVGSRIIITANGELEERPIVCLYDGSKRLTRDSGHFSIFDELNISELLFLGEEEDDVLTKQEVVEDILRYLDLHLMQMGGEFLLFSWSSLRDSHQIDFTDLVNGMQMEIPVNMHTYPIGLDMCSGTDTSISIGEVYNRLELTAEVEKVEDLIESPLESGSLYNVCRRYQKYIREFWSDGYEEFLQMVKGTGAVNRKGTGWTDWFIRLKGHRNWVFPGPDHDEMADWTADYHDGLQQHLVADLLREDVCHACILSIGSLKYDSQEYVQDNSPKSKISFTDYLCIGVNGDDIPAGVKMDSERHAEVLGDRFLRSAPVAVYHGGKSGGVFSPSDDDTTNYIVITGNMVLNPLMPMTAEVEKIRNGETGLLLPKVACRDGSRWLTRAYMEPMSAVSDYDVYDRSRQDEWYPFTDEGVQLYEFNFSKVGDETDKVSKVGVIACMLIIGDKCLVETNPSGSIESFEWRSYKERSECADDDEYYAQSFSIGFDPKLGDKLIGVSYPIGNNVDYWRGLDVEGMAIPISRSDRLSGKVTFKILGPYNSLWDDITWRHGSFWRHQKWTKESKVLMGHVSSILIDKFEMKLYSDNGFVNAEDDHDLVYVSDTDETFVNKKDDLSFKLTSALTAEEGELLQVPRTVNLSTPVTPDGEGVTTIYDANKDLVAKPEQLYVDAYYEEYHVPRVVLSQSLEDWGGSVSLFNRYTHPALEGKEFFVQNVIRDLQAGTAELTLKEK